MPANVEVTHGKDMPDMSAQAVHPGPSYVWIRRLMTVQPCGSFTFDNVIKKNEEFDVIMKVYFQDLLSELKVNYIANINVLNMKTGNIATPYSFTAKGQLPGGGVRWTTFRWKMKATETGIFLMSGSIGFPESRLFDFTLGSIAGTEPPVPQWGPTLKIANFYVYDPTED